MGFLSFCYRQLWDKPSPPPADLNLTGRTALVTGANVGLGLETARRLIQYKISHIILAVRDPQKGEDAKRDLQAGHHDCNIEVWTLDQNYFTSIEALIKRAENLDRLDYVVLNAGLMQKTFVKSPAGHELQLQVNYLSTALLCLRLLPLLKLSAKTTGQTAHLTLVTSELHMWTSFKQRTAKNVFEKLDDESSFNSDNYNVTKLLQVLWAQELASKTAAEEVIINTVNPGLCWSSLHRDVDNAGFRAFKHLIAWTSTEGADCIVNAVSVQDSKSHGGYLSEQKIKS